ncbi:MAG: SGNH/GDSL hydrolase family protein [Prolixibacteraceae bacterium]|nr:SGNH/GDSL hydrolase family protein [Prolixibacteraceae bacterium]
MKRILSLLVLIFFIFQVNAQIVYHNAADFPLMGKISSETETRYERLPGYLKDITRPPVWSLGKSTAGLAIRFRSNSTQIAVRWELLRDQVMNHMAFTGIKGLDLYTLENDNWIYVNTARPAEKITETIMAGGMEKKMREYMMFFPLYDGVTSLEIGVDSLLVIDQPAVQIPSQEKPIICYGTSITQGGCASRPGMAHTNILIRRLNREVINLGFSGNGKLDYEIAELIARSDPSAVLLDFVPNADVRLIEENTEKFYRIIRDALPQVPIFFIENPFYPKAKFDLTTQQLIKDKNIALRKIYNKLFTAGEKNIRLIPAEGMIGVDNEGTVDGVHFTDLGFMRYAEFLFPYLEEFNLHLNTF